MKLKRSAKIAIIIAGWLLVVGIYAGQAAEKAKFEAKFDKVESLDKDGKVIITNFSGNVDVKSWDQAQVKVQCPQGLGSQDARKGQRKYRKSDDRSDQDRECPPDRIQVSRAQNEGGGRF
jgi:hypothetical protein